MSGKQGWELFWLLIIASVLLVGCTGEPFAEAYTARGSAGPISDLETTGVFDTQENLQIVVRFNQHTENLRLETRWTDPTGGDAGELKATVPADAERLSIAFDLERAGRLYWQPGEWTVELRIDGKLETTLTFTVEGDIPEEALQDADIEAGESSDAEDGFDIDNPSNPFGN